MSSIGTVVIVRSPHAVAGRTVAAARDAVRLAAPRAGHRAHRRRRFVHARSCACVGFGSAPRRHRPHRRTVAGACSADRGRQSPRLADGPSRSTCGADRPPQPCRPAVGRRDLGQRGSANRRRSGRVAVWRPERRRSIDGPVSSLWMSRAGSKWTSSCSARCLSLVDLLADVLDVGLLHGVHELALEFAGHAAQLADRLADLPQHARQFLRVRSRSARRRR